MRHVPGSCPRCGAPHARQEEYCVECGQRLPSEDGPFAPLATAWASRTRYPGDWIWPVLGFLVLAALGALAAIALSGGGGAPTLVATPPTVTTLPTTTAVTTRPVTEPPVTQPTAPTTTTPVPPTRPGGLIAWPDRNGYTVVLQSIPTSSPRANAVRTAKQALAAGLRQVGVLESAAYASLHPGYYVVFSGVYATQAAAAAGVARAQAAGYPAAYARPVTR